MNRREKWLWLMLVILIILIIFVVFVLINNVDKKEDNKDNIDNNNLRTIEDILIEEKIWYCYNALYYLPDGTENILDTNGLQYKFYKGYIERCIQYNCQNYNYYIKDGILTLDGEYFDEEYTIRFEDNDLIMEEKRNDGSKIVYYFDYPRG